MKSGHWRLELFIIRAVILTMTVLLDVLFWGVLVVDAMLAVFLTWLGKSGDDRGCGRTEQCDFLDL